MTANGIHSAPTSFTITYCTSGISENNNTFSAGFSVYPNPTENCAAISFRTNAEEKYAVKVLDVFGRVVREESSRSVVGENTHQLNLSDVAKGVYTILLQKGGKTTVSKLILK